MSRSGYIDEDDDGMAGLWRGAVRSALQGKRGQATLQALAEAMDAMPVKTLAANSLVTADGEFCTLGVLGQSRGMDMSQIDPEDWNAVAKAFGIAPTMVREIVYMNDEHYTPYDYQRVEICGPLRPYRDERHPWARVDHSDPGGSRWRHMRKWVSEQLEPAAQRAQQSEGQPAPKEAP